LVNKGTNFQKMIMTLVDIQRQVFDSGASLGSSLGQLSKKLISNKAVRYEPYAKAPDSETEEGEKAVSRKESISTNRALSSPIKSPFLASKQ
jgi:hypothetical protein